MADTSAKLALVARLRAHAGLMGLVGGRVYPRRIPSWQATLPCLVYTKIEGPRGKILKGNSGVSNPLLQVSAWAATEAQAEAVAVQLRDALRPFRGTASGVSVQAISQEDERDSYDPPASAEEVGIYQVSIDVRIWHDE